MIFWSCFRGVRTLKIELSPKRELNFHFFAKFDFSLTLASILEPFWGPSSPLYSFLEVQSRFLEGCGSVLKKHQKKETSRILSHLEVEGDQGGLVALKPLNNRSTNCRSTKSRPLDQLTTDP